MFPEYPAPSRYAGVPVFFRHEEVLLETAGGLKNVEDLLLPGPVLVHNGDILAEVDLAALFAAHARSGALCTLALRSSGGELRVAFDAASGLVTDFRGKLGTTDPRFLYTGVCIVAPEFLSRIPSGQPVSFVPVWLEVLRAGGRIAGVVLDGGVWRDIGNIGEYTRVHADLAAGTVHVDPPATAPSGWPVWRSPDAEIDPAARLTGWTWCGPGCRIGAGARVADSVLWAGSRVEPGASVTNSVIREGMIAAGEVKGTVV
jgi:ADP-glucose pyrophosphorylase